jgi:hypothetical protein
MSARKILKPETDVRENDDLHAGGVRSICGSDYREAQYQWMTKPD